MSKFQIKNRFTGAMLTETREEHLKFCKRRALEYVDSGDLNGAFSSMASDLGKHSETANHIGIELGMRLLMIGDLNTSDKMRRFIEGFH